MSMVEFMNQLLRKFQDPYGILIWGYTPVGDKKRILVTNEGKLLFEGEILPPRAGDHIFKPEIPVTDVKITEVEVNAFLVSVRPKDGDIKANFGRTITVDEYSIIPKDTVKIVCRYTDKVYLQALAGQSAVVRVEGLKVS